MATPRMSATPVPANRGATLLFPARPRPQVRLQEFDARALRRRRRLIVAYFVQVAIHFIWWDYILKQLRLSPFRTPWVKRWQHLTGEYKQLALELQGLWVKLGQFLSTRVDVLPLEITRELESLRDEVPPESYETVIAQIESDFNCPFDEIFSWISPQPLGSASLAQVHRAHTASGETAVVKVLRPGIRQIIRADLKLLRQVGRWLKWIKPIARRANIQAMVDEFETVTNNELDLCLEARHVERFAADFADDPGVAAPHIHARQSTASTLTMEDVSFIRIDDISALEEVGISPKAVASKVYNVYLKQFFVTYRIHADPHPGNLFIRPLPTRQETALHAVDWPGYLPGDLVPYAPNRPFQLVLVDFGMFVEMPPRLREALRDFAIGLGLRDARRILDSYAKSGVVQSNADLDRLEEMIQTQLDELWGTFLGQMRQSDLTGPAAKAFFDKYEALISSTPFQFQTEMLFMMRAMGMLSGVTSSLDPEFDPWTETAPFARGLIQDDLINAVRGSFQDLLAGRLPPPLVSLLRTAPRAAAKPRHAAAAATVAPEEVRHLRTSVNRLTALVVAGGLCATGLILQSRGVQVSDVPALLWPGNNLGKWFVEISGITLVAALLRRGA